MAKEKQHPRLFITDKKIKKIINLINIPGKHHCQAFQKMKERVDQNDWKIYTRNRDGKNKNYPRSWLAREAAMMYQLTKKQKYADIAFRALQQMYQDPGEDQRLPDREGLYGLGRAMTGLGFAIAYDWTYHALSDEQRKFVRDKIISALEVCLNYRHANLETEHQGSNWVAVCKGAELIMHLAVVGDVDNDKQRQKKDSRVQQLINDLKTHIETAYGDSGWTQEGLGYLHYAFSFLAPAAYAAKDVGFPLLYKTLRTKNFYHLAMLSHSFREKQKMLQSGVGNESTSNEGFASLIFPIVSTANKGYYKYWYDHHLGINSPVPDFDSDRAATTWALIYYPDQIPAKYPAKEDIDYMIVDKEKGVSYWRNDFKDEQDILISLISRNDHHSHAWSQKETFQIAMMGFDTSFARGPVKKREIDQYSKLIVDREQDKNQGKGKTIAFKEKENGGQIVIDASKNFAIDKAIRYFSVDYSKESGLPAVIHLYDQLDDERPHDFWWQLKPDEGLQISTGEENNLPFFIFADKKKGSFLKGWFNTASQLDMENKNNKLLRIKMSGKSVTYQILMVMGKGDVYPRAGKQSGVIEMNNKIFSTANLLDL